MNAPMREQSVAETAFREWIKTLPKGAQINAVEAMQRGQSYTFDAWMEAWRQASLFPQTSNDALSDTERNLCK